MVTALSELNFQVVKIGVVRTGGSETFDEHVFVLLVKCPINGFLNVGHFHVDDGLLQWRN